MVPGTMKVSIGKNVFISGSRVSIEQVTLQQLCLKMPEIRGRYRLNPKVLTAGGNYPDPVRP
jgi:hypothetical protein